MWSEFRKYVMVALMILSSSGAAFPQLVPNMPDLYYVTVDPETGNDFIVWYSSPTPPNFTYYEVAVPLIPDPLSLLSIATVYPPDTMYVNTNTDSDLHSVGYTVWATNDLGGGSTFSSLYEEPLDSTIFLEAEYDTCGTSFTLYWNDYNKWRGNILEYNVYRRTGPGVYVFLATIDEGINTYVRDQLQPNQHFEIFVEAVHVDGMRRSTSNVVSFDTGLAPGPASVNADYATLGQNGGIDLSFTVSSSGSFQYNLVRSSNPAGSFSVIQQFDSQDSIFLLTDDIPFASGIYYYQLEVQNNCGATGTVSNLANNILLNGTLDDMNIMLQWNEYYDWNGGVQRYTVTRIAGVANPVVDMFDAGLMTSLNDDITSLADYSNPMENRICYQVEATENLNVYGTQGSSTSNLICFTVNTGIRLPNAIIPNDAEPVNRTFEPIFAFAPEHYEIVIYNRLGLKVWEGSGPWDGTINGANAPEGVYVYYARIFNYSTDITELSGSVAVVYR